MSRGPTASPPCRGSRIRPHRRPGAWRAGPWALAACAALLLGALPADTLRADECVDTTAPVLTSAIFHGRALTLTYNEPLDEYSDPDMRQFSVSVNGTAQPPTYVSIRRDHGPAAVTLTLGAAAASTDTVTLTYTVPASNPIRDRCGNNAARLTNQAVRYFTTAKPAAPDVSAVAGDRSVRVTAEMWDGGSTIVMQQWEVKSRNHFLPSGGSREFYRAYRIGGHRTRLSHVFERLTNDRTYYVRVEVANDYNQDSALDYAYSNVVSVTPMARVMGMSVEGESLSLSLNRELAGDSAPPGSAFEVTATPAEGGAGRTIAGTGTAAIDRHTVRVALASAVAAGERVTVRYRRPSTGDPLRDADGGLETPDFEGEAVAEPEPAALTAAFHGLPDAHDGERLFSFELRFSEDFPGRMDYKTLQDAAFRVENGRVREVKRAARGQNRRWIVTVRPASNEDVRLTLPAGAVSTQAGRALATTVSATVPGPPAPAALTAAFHGLPAAHDGARLFSFELRFNEDFPGRLDYRTLRDAAFRVENGRVRGARRAEQGHNRRWIVTVRPASHEDVVVTLPAAAVTTEGGRALANTVSATVRGPSLLSVADARVAEGAGATLAFAVSLSRAAAGPVTVDYATVDGTAKAGKDYTAMRGTLTFAAGETGKTVSVAVLDDAHDEGEESMRLRLSNAAGARIGDRVAVGIIENADPMPQAWLARFGRTVAEQVLDGVRARLAAPRTAGGHARVAGRPLGGADEADLARLAAAAPARWLTGAQAAAHRTRAPSAPELLAGSGFALTAVAPGDAPSAPGASSAALWGRGGWSRFDGNEHGLSVTGEVLAATLGADYATGRWLGGALLSHARGTGSYDGAAGAGAVESTLSGIFPYAGVDLSGRLTAWATAGVGLGGLTLTPEGARALDTGLTLVLAALGARGRLAEPAGGSGLSLAVETDGAWTRTGTGAVEGLAATHADTTRLRLGLEGGYRFALAGGGTLEPAVAVAVRHDGGDAETGYGMDLGGGLGWTDRTLGLSVQVSGRGLLTLETGGFRDLGVSGSLAWDPNPASDRGPSLTIRQTVGARAGGGMGALLGRATPAGLATADDGLDRGRLEVRAGYGFGADRFTATPEVGLALAGEQREYRLGWRFAGRGAAPFEAAVEGTRREHAAGAAPPEHALRLRMTARW